VGILGTHSATSRSAPIGDSVENWGICPALRIWRMNSAVGL
jgi:hypothetical protein